MLHFDAAAKEREGEEVIPWEHHVTAWRVLSLQEEKPA